MKFSYKLYIQYTFSVSAGYVNVGVGEYSTRYAFSMSFDLPEYSSVKTYYYFNGYVDDFLRVHLNGNYILNIQGNPGSEDIYGHWIPNRTYGFSNVYKTGTNTLNFYLYNEGNNGQLILYSTTVNVEYITK